MRKFLLWSVRARIVSGILLTLSGLGIAVVQASPVHLLFFFVGLMTASPPYSVHPITGE